MLYILIGYILFALYISIGNAISSIRYVSHIEYNNSIILDIQVKYWYFPFCWQNEQWVCSCSSRTWIRGSDGKTLKLSNKKTKEQYEQIEGIYLANREILIWASDAQQLPQ